MFRKLLYRVFSVLGQREVARFEAAAADPQAAQSDYLLKIISRNSQTEFGKRHDFSKIRTVEDFRSAVAINDYDSLEPYIRKAAAGSHNILTVERPIMFAATSGTTSAQKLIPVTESYIQEFRRASVVSGYNLLKHFPKVANGVTLSVVSPAKEGTTPGGIPYGAISGHLFQHEPKLIKKFIAPIPYEVYLIRSYEARYYTLLRIAIDLPLSCIYTLNPSTICLLMKRLERYREQLIADVEAGTITSPEPLPAQTIVALASVLKPNPKRAQELRSLACAGRFKPIDVWPLLQFVSCWTRAAASYYLEDFPELFGDTPVCDITYGASEGRGTVFLGPDKQALALRCHFYEFVEEDNINACLKGDTSLIVDIESLETGKNYFILFTTSGGLYRYHINDVVKVVGHHNKAPLLEFQYKGGNVSSFTGEKLTEYQVTQAATMTARSLANRKHMSFFTVIPQFKPEPHYRLWMELTDPTDPDPSSARNSDHAQSDDREVIEALFASEFDLSLQKVNVEYRAKRESGRLGAIVAERLTPGTYETVRRSLSDKGIPDAQIKLSHLNPKPELKEQLQKSLVGHPARK